MELSEIVSKEGRQPDCSGYVTKYDILCSDGKTIRPGAFNDDDGRKVPMVYMHDHKNLENVLGHMYLESRDDGVYGYGYLNASPKGQLAKLYVDAGDISCFSIFANQLKKKANDVMHGTIREVSLVLSGANRGAIIDSPIMHTDLDEAEGGEGVICMGEDYGGPIYGSDDALTVDEYLEHYGRKGMKWGKNIFEQEYEAHPREGAKENINETRKKNIETKQEVRKNASSQEINRLFSAWKDAWDNERKNTGGGDLANKLTNERISIQKELGMAIKKYMEVSNLDQKETEEFLNELQNRFDKNGMDLDAHRIYDDGSIASKSFSQNLNNENQNNTHGLTSREKNVTGEGKPIAKRGESLNSGNLPANIASSRPSEKPSNKKEEEKPAEKITGALQSGLDTLKDLGAKAVNAGKEAGDKAGEILSDAIDKLKSLFKHSDLTDEEAEDIIMHYISGDITMDDILSHADEGRTVREVFNDMTDEQKSCVYYFMLKARQAVEDSDAKHSDEDDESLEHSDKEDNKMKHNVFDDARETQENTLSHSDMEKLTKEVFGDAKAKGSLRDSFLAHADDYGIDNIDYLFPDAKNATNTPTWIKRPDSWVRTVMNGVGRNPFSRIKSVFADITEPDARARGYIKGNKKVEEVFGLLKRTTTPTTVYKKQKLDRDDIIDITDFDVVAWLKTEMRGMLDEELARAFLIGDGRSPASNDKINEGNIRPIWKDDDLFVIRKGIAVTSSTTTEDKCKAFIRAVIKARKDYRGSGNPVLFTTEDMLTDMLLLEDEIGHALYESEEKLATKLRVRSIVTVPVFENISRTSGNVTLDLMGIVVNLNDYKVGADKGGSVNMFEDFDIDYNQEKYLIETRCSGALVVPYSAIVIESSSSVVLDVDPDDPTTSRYGKLVSALQSDVVVNDDSVFGTLHYTTGYTGFSGDESLQSGYYLALKFNTTYGATTTLQLLNNGGSGDVITTDDDYVVCYIRSKNAKLVIETTAAGVSISKTLSMRGLKLVKD